MNRLLGLVIAVVAGSAAHAQNQVSAGTPVTLFSGTEVVCDVEDDDVNPCPVPIDIALVEDETTKRVWCTAVFPGAVKVYGRKPKAKHRRIVWELKASGLPSGYGVAFAPAPVGISVLSDHPRKPQWVEGGIGDGYDDTSAIRYYARLRRNVQNAYVLYAPVVLMTNSANEISVCAAADPKIVNAD